MRRSAASIAIVLCLSCGVPRDPWNVLVICLDTVRFDTFWLPEGEGVPDAFSPWAERALRFDHALAPSPWTLPSVASLLTGRYPASHGAGFPGDTPARLGEVPPAPLTARSRTLTEILSAHGYRTGGVVANPFVSAKFGFGDAFALRSGATAGRIAREAATWLDNAAEADAPWFLYLHLVDAHARRFRQSAGELETKVGALPGALARHAADTAPGELCRSGNPRHCQIFLAYVHDVLAQRRAVAELLDDLSHRGALARTIVVLYSDHGEEFLDHAEAQRARGTNRRGAKGIYGWGHGHAMYQELLHVPLLVWHPEQAGRVVTTNASLVDVVPTLLDWLAIDVPDVAWEGLSLAGEVPADEPRFASSIASGPPQSVVVRDHWKLIRRADPDEHVLFDLRSDPLERAPVDDAVRASELEALLDRHLEAVAPPSAPAPALTDDELRALQDLGYLIEAPLEAP